MSNYYLNFDGTTNASVTVPDNFLDLEQSNEFFISFWVKTSDVPVSDTYIFNYYQSGLISGWNIKLSTNGKIYLSMFKPGTTVYTYTDIAINDGKWHYICFNGYDNMCYPYVDSVEGTAVDYTSIDEIGVGTVLDIASFYDGNNKFIGAIDDIRITIEHKTQANIDSYYNSGIGTKIINSNSWLWASNCDTGSGTVLSDDGTVGYNGVLSSADVWESGGYYAVDSYIIYRQKDEEDAIFDSAALLTDATITVDNPTEDGIYYYTRTQYDKNCDKESDYSSEVSLTVSNGVVSQQPLADPENLSLQPIADGRFYLYFNYNSTVDDPITHFNIYYDLSDSPIDPSAKANPSVTEWFLDGTLQFTYNSIYNKFRYTTEAQANDNIVNYKVVPVVAIGSTEYERDNDTTVTGTSDSEAPDVTTDYIVTTLL